MAEFERTKIVDRNRRGKVWRARQEWSPCVPYGYRKVLRHVRALRRIEVCEKEATVVRQAFDWHANEGLSIRQIAIRLIEAGIPSPRATGSGTPRPSTRCCATWAPSTTTAGSPAPTPRVPRYRRASAAHPDPAARGMDRHRAPPLVDLGTPTPASAPATAAPGATCCVTANAGKYAEAQLKENGEYRYDHGAADAPAGREAALLQPSARADELDELVWNEVVRHLDHPERRACAVPTGKTLTTDAMRQLTAPPASPPHRRLPGRLRDLATDVFDPVRRIQSQEDFGFVQVDDSVVPAALDRV